MNNRTYRVLEDLLRVEINRAIGISHRSVGFLAGSKPMTEWEHIVTCIHRPLIYRLSLIKYFFFEMRELNPQLAEVLADQVQRELSEVKKVPPLELTRILIKCPPQINIQLFWESVFTSLLEIIEDMEYWHSMEKRLTCLNDK